MPPRKLSDAQIRQAKARHYLYRVNHPKRIAADLGIGRETLNRYVREERRP